MGICLLAAVYPKILIAQSLPPLQPEQDACNALQLCGGSFYTPYSYTGFGTIKEQSQPAACFDESNSVWFRIVVTAPGIIVFSITPVNTTNDYDFAVYDVTGLTCNDINATTRVRCNGADIFSSPGGVTGLNTTSAVTVSGPGPGVPFCMAINANVGDTYLLMVDNFETTNVAGFTIDFTGSTANFFDATPPAFASIKPSCDLGKKVTVTLTEPVLCSSIAANGSDFYITPAGSNVTSAVGVNCTGPVGYTNQIVLNFAPSLPGGTYTLHAQNGTDGNTLIDLCGNQQLTTDAIQFTVPDNTPPKYKYIDSPACQDIYLVMDRPVRCSAISATGSEFYIIGPSAAPIESAVGLHCAPNDTLIDTIHLHLVNPILVDGVYTINSRMGTDGNSLLDSCGNMQVLNDKIHFTVNSWGGLIVAAPKDSAICEPGYVNLRSTVKTNPPVGGSFVYAWNPPLYVNDSSAANTFAYVDQTTTFIVRTVNDRGCVVRDSARIFVSDRNATITPSDTTICHGDQVQLIAGGGVKYRWLTNTPKSISCLNCAEPVVLPTQNEIYYAIIADKFNCADTLVSKVNMKPVPVIDIVQNDTLTKFGSPVKLKVTGGDSYSWHPVKGIDNPYSDQPMVNPTEPTTYVVYGLDGNGCMAADSILIDLDMRDKIYLPTAFTPNEDGVNDLFRIKNLTFQKVIEFRVFNRWGQEVFNGVGSGQAITGWDGTFSGEPAAMGNYQYLIRVAYPDNYVQLLKGDVQLVR